MVQPTTTVRPTRTRATLYATRRSSTGSSSSESTGSAESSGSTTTTVESDHGENQNNSNETTPKVTSQSKSLLRGMVSPTSTVTATLTRALSSPSPGKKHTNPVGTSFSGDHNTVHDSFGSSDDGLTKRKKGALVIKNKTAKNDVPEEEQMHEEEDDENETAHEDIDNVLEQEKEKDDDETRHEIAKTLASVASSVTTKLCRQIVQQHPNEDYDNNNDEESRDANALGNNTKKQQLQHHQSHHKVQMQKKTNLPTPQTTSALGEHYRTIQSSIGMGIDPCFVVTSEGNAIDNDATEVAIKAVNDAVARGASIVLFGGGRDKDNMVVSIRLGVPPNAIGHRTPMYVDLNKISQMIPPYTPHVEVRIGGLLNCNTNDPIGLSSATGPSWILDTSSGSDICVVVACITIQEKVVASWKTNSDNNESVRQSLIQQHKHQESKGRRGRHLENRRHAQHHSPSTPIVQQPPAGAVVLQQQQREKDLDNLNKVLVVDTVKSEAGPLKHPDSDKVYRYSNTNQPKQMQQLSPVLQLPGVVNTAPTNAAFVAASNSKFASISIPNTNSRDLPAVGGTSRRESNEPEDDDRQYYLYKKSGSSKQQLPGEQKENKRKRMIALADHSDNNERQFVENESDDELHQPSAKKMSVGTAPGFTGGQQQALKQPVLPNKVVQHGFGGLNNRNKGSIGSGMIRNNSMEMLARISAEIHEQQQKEQSKSEEATSNNNKPPQRDGVDVADHNLLALAAQQQLLQQIKRQKDDRQQDKAPQVIEQKLPKINKREMHDYTLKTIKKLVLSASEGSNRTEKSKYGKKLEEKDKDAAAKAVDKKDGRSSSTTSPDGAAKKHKRLLVQHIYRDFSDEVPTDDERALLEAVGGAEDEDGGTSDGVPKISCSAAFPIKLHETLSRIEYDGYGHIIGWLPHGRSFKIFRQQEFSDVILPKYFIMTKKSSFLRQLNLYGFNRISGGTKEQRQQGRGSSDQGSYYHEKFLRGMKFLCLRIKRMKVNGHGIRAASNPEQEPVFSRYTVCPPRPVKNTSAGQHNAVLAHANNNSRAATFVASTPPLYSSQYRSTVVKKEENQHRRHELTPYVRNSPSQEDVSHDHFQPPPQQQHGASTRQEHHPVLTQQQQQQAIILQMQQEMQDTINSVKPNYERQGAVGASDSDVTRGHRLFMLAAQLLNNSNPANKIYVSRDDPRRTNDIGGEAGSRGGGSNFVVDLSQQVLPFQHANPVIVERIQEALATESSTHTCSGNPVTAVTPREPATADIANCSGIISTIPGAGQPASCSFPLKFQRILDKLEAEGKTDIASWQPHGRAFIVHDVDRFVNELMPMYFNQSKYSSFQRQLHMYNFQRITARSNPDKGAYHHPCFQRSKPELSLQMQRTRVNGKGTRQPSEPDKEPKFYNLPPLPKIPFGTHIDIPIGSISLENQHQ